MPDYTWQAFEETVQKEHCPCFVYSGTELSLLGADTTNNMKTLGVTHIFEKGRDDQKIVRWVNYYAENGRFDDE